MYVSQVIKVLIIDDSIFFREILAEGIASDKRIEVVGVAGDPFEARDKILELNPDVITLDIEMPRMDGLEFLRKLLPQYPIATLVVSVHGDKVLSALESGAVDFVKKPLKGQGNIMEVFIQELIVKIKIASMANVSAYKNKSVTVLKGKMRDSAEKNVIAIGASTGGTEAIHQIIQALPRNMPGIVVVQHMPEVFTRMYSERLNSVCQMEVKEAQDGDYVCPGRVLIAPGGSRHMIIRKIENGYIVKCYEGEKVNGHRPSVDVMFQSMAKAVGSDAIGVLLTGMGYDGAKGLLEMKKAGAITLGQDEESSVVYGMPKVAFDIGGVMEQLPLNAIAQKLYTLADI